MAVFLFSTSTLKDPCNYFGPTRTIFLFYVQFLCKHMFQGIRYRHMSAMRGTWVLSLGWEDPLEKGKAANPSTLACRVPWTVAYQAPLSRQEYWSGLPCPPPEDLPNPGIKPRLPALQADSLLSEPPGKPKNTWKASLFLLQAIFLIQESNPGLLHCRQILY